MLGWEALGHARSAFCKAGQGRSCPSLSYQSTWLAHSRCSLNLGQQKNEGVHLHNYSFHKYQCPLCASLFAGVGTQRQ